MNLWLLGLNHLRFRQKLILSYFAVTLVPIMILGLYSYNQSKLFLQKQAEQGLRDTVGAITDGFNARLVRYNGIIDSIVMNAGLQRIFSNKYDDLTNLSYDVSNYLDPYFNMILYLHNDIKQLKVYSQGKLPEIGEYMVSAEKVRETDWYREAQSANATRWYYRNSEFIAARQFPDIYISKNITVLYMKFDPNQVFAGIGDRLSENYGIAISDSERNIVFSNRNLADEEEKAKIRNLISRGNEIVNIDGRTYIVIQKQIPLPGWTLSYYIPSNQISVGASSIVKATIVVVLICLLILLALVWLSSHTLIKPIDHLNKKMREVARGNLQVVVSSPSRDEIGELTNRFGHMLGRINELIREAYQNKIIQKEAELKALQSQINPHFLYNTLSIIKWKSLQIDAQDISELVTALSEFYRTALNRGGNIIAVRDELENIRSYVQIQLIMHDNNFDVVYELDERIYDYDMINLVLQPIVENAIEHGIERKRERRGQIRIEGRVTEAGIAFIVEDNGPGLDPELSQTILSAQTSGYGLKNVHERIRLFFGEEHGITIESEPGAGTRMKVNFPLYRRS